MPRITIVLTAFLAVVAGCADRPRDVEALSAPCYAANADSSEPIPTASLKRPPPSNIFKMGYIYPEGLRARHVQGRVLVRLKVAESGRIDSAELLRVEAPPPVELAACDLLRKLQYDLSKPGFDTVDSRTFFLSIRYCLGNCSRVPMYPGFEMNEIVMTTNP